MPSFIYKNKEIEYTLSRKATKNTNFTVKPNGEIYISVPKFVTKKELNSQIEKMAKWLVETQEIVLNKAANQIEKNIKNGSFTFIGGKKYLVKIIGGISNKVYLHSDFISVQIKEKYIDNQKYINSFFNNWQREILYNMSEKFMIKYLELLSIKGKTPTLQIRSMTGRWGSCTPAQRNIIINANLIYYPFECLEYIVLHEVTHLIVPNHSQNFYLIIESAMPDWKSRKNILREF